MSFNDYFRGGQPLRAIRLFSLGRANLIMPGSREMKLQPS
jgi:hypothetical protein